MTTSLSKGDTFYGRWITGNPIIIVMDVDDKLSVFIKDEKTNCGWNEEWNLQHTIWGFERGDYYGHVKNPETIVKDYIDSLNKNTEVMKDQLESRKKDQRLVDYISKPVPMNPTTQSVLDNLNSLPVSIKSNGRELYTEDEVKELVKKWIKRFGYQPKVSYNDFLFFFNTHKKK